MRKTERPPMLVDPDVWDGIVEMVKRLAATPPMLGGGDLNVLTNQARALLAKIEGK